MNFDYTDEQNMLRDSIAKWAAGQYDFDKRREALKSEDAWKKNWATFAELGLLAAPLPEEFGGLGGGAIDISVGKSTSSSTGGSISPLSRALPM